MDSQQSSSTKVASDSAESGKVPSWKLKIRALQEGEELRRVKYAKTRGGMPMSSALNLVVIGTGAPGSPACILINGDHANYLVNCGESVQRILVEHSLRLSKVEHIFCTSKAWRNVGGLLGMCLTLQQAAVPSITLHGHADCLHMVRLHGGFADDRFNDSQLRHHDYEKIGCFEDANFVVKMIELDHRAPDQPAESRASNSTHLFVFQPKSAPPNVDPKRVSEIGISKADGPLIKDLKEHFDDPSFSVTLSNGRVVHPADICKPQTHCGPIIVFECPSLDFLHHIWKAVPSGAEELAEDSPPKRPKLATEQRNHAFSDLCDGLDPALVVHMTHFAVGDCAEYQLFIDSFPAATRHLVLDGSCTSPACVGVYRNQAIMHLAHPQIFPLLPGMKPIDIDACVSNATQSANTTDTRPPETDEPHTERVMYARPGLRFQIRPRPSFNGTMCLRVSHEEFVREAFAKSADLKAVSESLEQHRTSVSSSGSNYPRFVFLGTGSSVPSKTRNVSAFLVEMDAQSCLLFDCGEGTYAQLVRHYGDETDCVLGRLRAVFVSHMHADHHGGLFTMLTEWRRVAFAGGSQSRLVLFAPQRIASWFKVYAEIVLDNDSTLLDHVELVAAQDLCPLEMRPKGASERPPAPSQPQSHIQLQPNDVRWHGVLIACGIRSIVAVPVLHACQPYGFVVTLTSGIKLVYSGDTMPCDRLVDAGLDCDVLVHESTMEDDLHAEAKLKKHSTIGQAVDVARRMRARYCILTHFSQRYSKIPPVYSSAQLFNTSSSTHESDVQVGVAFDHMRVTLNDIPFFKHLLPFLKSAFPDCFEVMANNLEKRTLKKLRELEDDVTN